LVGDSADLFHHSRRDDSSHNVAIKYLPDHSAGSARDEVISIQSARDPDRAAGRLALEQQVLRIGALPPVEVFAHPR
jgi:hypothetical protein